MKKNILQLIGSFHQGGSERQAVKLTGLLHQDGTYNVFAATLNKVGILLDDIESLNLGEIPEFKLTSFYNPNLVKQLRRFSRYLKENKIHLVHTHDFYTNVFVAASLAGVPVKIASKRETNGMRSASQNFIEKLAFRRADAIVANSEAVKSYLISQAISAEKISVIYNGLGIKQLTPKITNSNVICENLGLPADENIRFITMVANLRHTVKNQPMFLRVAQRVLQKFPDTHFVLAGEGELKDELENLAKNLEIEKNTHLIGRCMQIPELLHISYAGVLTSFAEGFSNSILEYMAARKPVVATKVGGASEAVIDGETGFLINSDDDEVMANRLIELLDDEKKAIEFGEKGRRIIEEKFSLDAQLSKTLSLYERHLSK